MKLNKSSVEWLASNLDKYIAPGNQIAAYALVEQAKAMHEKEHRDTWIQSEYQQRDEYECSKKGILSFEEYYSETFKTIKTK